MANTTDNASLIVKISSDRLEAELIVPAGFDRASLLAELCHAQLLEAGVEVTERVVGQIEDLIEKTPPAGSEYRAVVSQGTAAGHGQDSHVEWLATNESPEAAQAMGSKDDAQADSADSQQESHYDRCAFIMATAGETLGILHPATTGVDGRDVTGKTLAASDGKDCNLQLDDTILRDGQGKLIAQSSGMLLIEGDKATIRADLEIDENVDFSTGNIDFPGSVQIRKGIKDCFIVKAAGDVQVGGLIEAATILCGGNLTANGGFAGRERGNCEVGGNLIAKYLDNVHGHVRGDLRVEREVINCAVVVHGAIVSPSGAIVGGEVTCTRDLNINTLGSGAGAETVIHLDTVPRLDCYMTELNLLVDEFTQRKTKMTDEQEQITKLSTKGRMTATDKERQCEIMYEVSEIDQNLSRAVKVRDTLAVEIDKERTLNVKVDRRLNAGVVLKIRDQKFRITSEVKGPMQIYRGGKDVLLRRGEGEPDLLSKVAEVR